MVTEKRVRIYASRMTDSDYELIQKAVKASKSRSVSDFMRMAAVETAQRVLLEGAVFETRLTFGRDRV